MKTNNRVIIIVLSVVAVILGSFAYTAMNNSGKDYIDRLIDKYKPQGAAVAIIKNGEIVEVRNYGYANVEQKINVDNTTQFKIASISKTITAYAVMQLVDEGKLDLDVPVNHYLKQWQLPDTEFDEDKVTLRTLLSHTSGVTGSDEYGYEKPLPTISEALKSRNVRLKREPGEVFEYSEFAGLGICQLVIEEVTGVTFEQYMKEYVFDSLGMKNTDYSNGEDGHFATAYAGINKPIEVTPIVMNGAGGVSTTATDLGKFAVALINYYNTGTHEMFKAQKNTTSFAGVYALGVIPRELKNGITVYEHNGTLTGWNAQLVIEPKHKDGIVILTNSDKAYYLTYELMEKWGANVVGEKVIDLAIQKLKNVIWIVIEVLLLINLLILFVMIKKFKTKKWILNLKNLSKATLTISTLLEVIFIVSYYFIVYTEVPFELIWGMKNYYLFTFFPLSFIWVNGLLMLLAVLLWIRVNCICKYSKKIEVNQTL